MKKIVLSLAVVFLIGAKLTLAQVPYQADFDTTFGSTSPGFTNEASSRIPLDIAFNSFGEIVAVIGTGIAIYSPNGTHKRSIVFFRPDGYMASFSKVKIVEGSNIIVAGYILVNGVYERFVGKFDANLQPIKSFGVGGFSYLKDGIYNHQINDMTIQNDGKIVVVGEIYKPNITASYAQFTTRYNSNGTIDTSFSSDGTVYESINNNYTRGTSVAILLGNIVVAGTHLNGGSHLVMYDNAGNRQMGFNAGQIKYGVGHKVVVQPDNKIIASSGFNSYNLSLTRLNPNGTTDTTFGTNGTTTYSFAPGFAVTINKLGLDSQLGIIVAGDYNSKSFIARLVNQGTLDPTFRTSYRQTLPAGANLLNISAPAPNHLINDFEYQGEKIVLACYAYQHPIHAGILTRLNGRHTN